MFKFQNPIQKGTDVLPSVTIGPPVVRVLGMESDPINGQKIVDHYSGMIGQFHQAQRQNYGLSTSEYYKNVMTFPDGQIQYVNMQGQEIITLTVSPKVLEELNENQMWDRLAPVVILTGDMNFTLQESSAPFFAKLWKDIKDIYHVPSDPRYYTDEGDLTLENLPGPMAAIAQLNISLHAVSNITEKDGYYFYPLLDLDSRNNQFYEGDEITKLIANGKKYGAFITGERYYWQQLDLKYASLFGHGDWVPQYTEDQFNNGGPNDAEFFSSGYTTGVAGVPAGLILEHDANLIFSPGVPNQYVVDRSEAGDVGMLALFIGETVEPSTSPVQTGNYLMTTPVV